MTGRIHARRRRTTVTALCTLVSVCVLGLSAAGPVETSSAATKKYSRFGYYTPQSGDLVAPYNTVPTWAGVVMDAKTRLPKVLYNGKPYWNAVTVALFGLQEYDRFLAKGSPARWAGARRAADWLVRRQARDGVWEYRMAWSYPRENQQFALPWIAAQAQGNALSLLVRVMHTSGDTRYKRAIRRALGPFERAVGQRGVRRVVREHVFYEGFPSATPSLTLEDFQLALLGLYDAAAYSKRARGLFDTGLSTLSWSLPLYTDERGRPLYDLLHIGGTYERFYKPDAHPLIAGVLATLAQVSGDPRLGRYATLWAATQPR